MDSTNRRFRNPFPWTLMLGLLAFALLLNTEGLFHLRIGDELRFFRDETEKACFSGGHGYSEKTVRKILWIRDLSPWTSFDWNYHSRK